jgi:Flp pilus assembly protein TadG
LRTPRLPLFCKRRGQALIEASLMMPMLFFLFLGMTNFGFYIYAFIEVGNAARVAAQFTANGLGGNQAAACQAALRELKSMPNVYTLADNYACGANPLTVTVVPPTDPDPGVSKTWVQVSYQTIKLFPLPFMSGQMIINRHAVMRTMN